ncbi:hypothetical protein NWP22_05815 [Anabaenopsis tanganyikae CS-531]|uniref:HNH endonuclease n=2 Tax=Anabaenopsis TaxID=110103 RepID=A0ABT6KC06_9CYAN|nr:MULTISPECIES: hypothetical protein [Anabaenopsis]MDB9541450.1 hypothetical protein [Anabaenopsis arnoldii]MDH6090429.1 hypothetical protein [Anabaenopsis arnoldii]MDH6105387.1 hypothetical protein [Anabaenopsis tanganyikae CS-531]
MRRRCDRNRKRSKRRDIYCPIHGCYLDSVSQKYRLFADKAGQLQERGLSRRAALLSIANYTAVTLHGEWLEAFWCEHCQEKKWYYVCQSSDDGRYDISLAPKELWQQVTGVIDPDGNPSVGEFTRLNAKQLNHHALNNFYCL